MKENVVENVVCETVPIMSRGRWVNAILHFVADTV